MSWIHCHGKPGNRKRALPEESTGKAPIPPGRYIKKGLLLAALKFWEVSNHIEPDPELIEARAHWKRRPHGC